MAYRRPPAHGSLRHKTVYGVKESLRLGMAATLAISPLLAYHFGRFSLVSMIANPLIAPAVSLAMIGAFAAFPLAALAPGIAGWTVGAVVRPFLGWLLLASSALATIPFAEVEVPEFSAWLLVPVYAGLVSLWRWRPVAP
jgi:competence protein ComEC